MALLIVSMTNGERQEKVERMVYLRDGQNFENLHPL